MENVQKFMLLLYGNEEEFMAMSEADMQASSEQHATFREWCGSTDITIAASEVLQPSVSTSTRLASGEVRNGAFEPSPWQLMGWYLLACRDEAQALEAAEKCPEPSIEIRGVVLL